MLASSAYHGNGKLQHKMAQLSSTVVSCAVL